jgi:hypothetical protein
MEHLTIELVLWILLAFFIGCIIGCLLRQAVSGRRAADMAAADAEPVEQAGGADRRDDAGGGAGRGRGGSR